ncbi:hypothetical protein [Mycolicibacterium lutetiense]
MTYAIVQIPTAADGVVTIPEQTAWKELGYTEGQTVVVTANGKKKYFMAVSRTGADGDQLFVKTRSFRPEDAGGSVTIAKSNPLCARLHFLFASLDGTLLWVGLVMSGAAAIAQAIKSAQSTPSLTWIVVAAICQIVGLILALVGAVRTRKP